ncbi:helicase protein [Cooperia oncophora]
MEDVWVVFPCAHTVCTNCIKNLRRMTTSSFLDYIRCVTCRRPCPVDGTMYVVNKTDELIPNIRLTVKFEQIIRLLKKLIAEDPTNKILVFTSIAIVIPPFAALLKLLKIPYAVPDRGSRSKTLHRFRHDHNLKVLLMPLRMGANGLNLTEANHIIFMEPITETSVLSQAVGRLDRIGQRRTVTVHNFVVKGSIEEEIYKIVSDGKEQSRWTLETLYQVFGLPLHPGQEHRFPDEL